MYINYENVIIYSVLFGVIWLISKYTDKTCEIARLEKELAEIKAKHEVS